jgi:lipopolysaccharide/colanic/teichoic acid biosynthesis glycosyltransferase
MAYSVKLAQAKIMNNKKISPIYRFFKRLFDFLGALLAFVILLPLMILIGLGVLIASRGPVLYRDCRMGKGGKPIKILKFRTMYADANDHPEKYFNVTQMQQWSKERKVDNDPRIVPFGNFLRKTSFDELPQLVNIIAGSMAIVGPRAITEDELKTYYKPEEQSIILSVRPGLTGYWQVHGRNKVTYESGERAKMEMKYFEKMGLFHDFVIILKTIPALFRKDEAM